MDPLQCQEGYQAFSQPAWPSTQPLLYPPGTWQSVREGASSADYGETAALPPLPDEDYAPLPPEESSTALDELDGPPPLPPEPEPSFQQLHSAPREPGASYLEPQYPPHEPELHFPGLQQAPPGQQPYWAVQQQQYQQQPWPQAHQQYGNYQLPFQGQSASTQTFQGRPYGQHPGQAFVHPQGQPYAQLLHHQQATYWQLPHAAPQQAWPAEAMRPQPAPVLPAPQPQPPPLQVKDAIELFRPPGRLKRPKKIALVLRGLPGSGKSYAARRMREIEVEEGGTAPRIHSIDDYFVTEVEKEVEEAVEGGKKVKKRKIRSVQYCYEAELEGTYKASLLRAFSRTAEEGRFPFVIVDAPNIRVDDFKDYWSVGQKAGYEVYIVGPLEKDPEACIEADIHEREAEDIWNAFQQWEATPARFPRLDITGLLSAHLAEQQTSQQENQSAAPRSPAENDGDRDASQSASSSSRWANIDVEYVPEREEPSARKKAKAAVAERLDGLADGLDDLLDPGKRGAARPGLKRAGGLARGPGRRKTVRWADEITADTGFRIGGGSAHQLETVHVLEGLGPSRKDAGVFEGSSFAEQAKKDRRSEQDLFRAALFGGRG